MLNVFNASVPVTVLIFPLGFMYGTKVLDKDGISGLSVAAEYATTLYKKGTNFAGELEMIYRK